MNEKNAVRAGEADNLTVLTADIVSAYVANNTVTASGLPEVIDGVSQALTKAAAQAQAPHSQEQVPAVSVRKSVTPDYIICLEDGKKFKTLKRHLRTHYNLSPVEYREKWSLPHDYPIVAPNYSASRSALAQKIGLGRKRKA